jgi:hypothetical protein
MSVIDHPGVQAHARAWAAKAVAHYPVNVRGSDPVFAACDIERYWWDLQARWGDTTMPEDSDMGPGDERAWRKACREAIIERLEGKTV